MFVCRFKTPPSVCLNVYTTTLRTQLLGQQLNPIKPAPFLRKANHQLRSSCSCPCSCSSSSSSLPEVTCPSCSATWCPLISSHLLSLTFADQLFTSLLSKRLHAALKEQDEKKVEAEKEEEEVCPSREVSSHVEATQVGCPLSRDGYFEMGLDDSVQDSSPPPPPLPTGLSVPPSDPCDVEQQEENINNVIWCYCLKVEKEEKEVEQSIVCVVLTHNLLCLLRLSRDDGKGTHLNAGN